MLPQRRLSRFKHEGTHAPSDPLSSVEKGKLLAFHYRYHERPFYPAVRRLHAFAH